jgi:probable HAF family extracellular repeat protein
VAGYSNLEGDTIRHAVLWRGHSLVDLKTLGGRHSNVQWHGLNDRGWVVGIAETSRPDPYGQEWSCSAFFPTTTNLICRGFWWDGEGRIKPLPTLGGYNSYAAAVNNHGQIVGWAETKVEDDTCDDPQVLQFRAVLWEPKKGRKKQLRPYRGDSASAATDINARGQAVGISGECDIAVGRESAKRAVMWDNGKVKDLGNLGGENWHTPTAISERGDVVGFSNPPGLADPLALAPLAFLWTKHGGIRSLDRLPGDSTSQAAGINSARQVVGTSSSATGVNRAFLWEDGRMKNLNELAEFGFPDSLISAHDINEKGEILARIIESGSGRTLPVLLIPKRVKD